MIVATSPWWLMAVYIGGASLYGRIDKFRYDPTTHFDPSKWQKPDRKYRFAVLDTVAKQIITPGIPENRVTELLGKPDAVDTNSNWQYETKRPGWRFIDWTGGGLLIEFNTNRLVQKTIINTWVD